MIQPLARRTSRLSGRLLRAWPPAPAACPISSGPISDVSGGVDSPGLIFGLPSIQPDRRCRASPLAVRDRMRDVKGTAQKKSIRLQPFAPGPTRR